MKELNHQVVKSNEILNSNASRMGCTNLGVETICTDDNALKDVGFSMSYSPWLRALVNDINLAYLASYYLVIGLTQYKVLQSFYFFNSLYVR